jgi:hypothetical protein
VSANDALKTVRLEKAADCKRPIQSTGPTGTRSELVQVRGRITPQEIAANAIDIAIMFLVHVRNISKRLILARNTAMDAQISVHDRRNGQHGKALHDDPEQTI